MKRLSIVVGLALMGLVVMVGGAAAGAGDNITQGLISYWELNETSGTRYDSHGSHDLTDHGGVGFTSTGVISNAAQFYLPDDEYLSAAHSDDLSMNGAQDFTIAMWVYGEFWSTHSVKFMEKWSEYRLLHDTYYHTEFGVYAPWEYAHSASFPTNNEWHFIVGWRNTLSNTINVQIDNGTVYTTVRTNDGYSATNELTFLPTQLALTQTVQLDQAGVWTRTLTTSERAWLYNGGMGRAYDAFSGGSVPAFTLPVVPTPFPVPTIDPDQELLDVSLFWDVENVSIMVSMARSVLVFADRYKFFSLTTIVILVWSAVFLIARIVGDREETV